MIIIYKGFCHYLEFANSEHGTIV